MIVAVQNDTVATKAPLHGVALSAWHRFVDALAISDDERDPHFGRTRPWRSKTPAGGYGCFDLRPRRLVDIRLMQIVRVDNTSGREVVTGRFRLPMTEARFLGSPDAQLVALVESLRRYDRSLSSAKLPDGMTRSGALALHHRLGPRALEKWTTHREKSTEALYQRTNGLF